MNPACVFPVKRRNLTSSRDNIQLPEAPSTPERPPETRNSNKQRGSRTCSSLLRNQPSEPVTVPGVVPGESPVLSILKPKIKPKLRCWPCRLQALTSSSRCLNYLFCKMGIVKAPVRGQSMIIQLHKGEHSGTWQRSLKTLGAQCMTATMAQLGSFPPSASGLEITCCWEPQRAMTATYSLVRPKTGHMVVLGVIVDTERADSLP